MTSFENVPMSQKVGAAIHRDARAIGTETCHHLGLEITKPAMEIIAELVYNKLLLYGLDLEAFAKHAKRATVTSEDVKLLVRRNPSLKILLNKISPAVPSVTKEKRRKTVTKPTGTPKTVNDADSSKEDPDKSKSTKQIEVEKEKEHNLDDFVDNMILDSTIDLTD